MSTPLISIIIPAYNIEKCLSATLDSVLAQTYSNIEIIVVNDGSKDGTGAVIDYYAARHRCIKAIHKENGGVTSARLRGVAEATGEWIGFVDGDDFTEPQMYERLLDNALKYKVDISHCGYQMVLPSGTVRHYHNTGCQVKHDRVTGLQELLSCKRVEPGLWNKLYKKSLFHGLLHNDVMDLSIRNHEDWLMNYYLFREAEASFFEDVCLYHYIVRTGSAANAAVNRHKLEDPLKVKQILFQETIGQPQLHPVIANQLVRQLVRYATMSVKTSPEVTRPVRANARAELRNMLPQLVKSKDYSIKFKLMGIWATLWPWCYGFVHRMYEKLTGLDKIYEK